MIPDAATFTPNPPPGTARSEPPVPAVLPRNKTRKRSGKRKPPPPHDPVARTKGGTSKRARKKAAKQARAPNPERKQRAPREPKIAISSAVAIVAGLKEKEVALFTSLLDQLGAAPKKGRARIVASLMRMYG